MINRKAFSTLFALLCCLAFTASAAAQETSVPQTPTAPPAVQPAKKANARPATNKTGEPYDKAAVAEMAGKCVTLITDEGAIEIEMLAEAAPETVRNFLNLTATNAFDTTTFSRVVPDFVIQGGDLATRATLTPQLSERAVRTIPDEPNYIKHVRGVVSMARAAAPNSATTNFFILVNDAPHLDGTFAAFGTVRNGMDVVDRINKASVENENPKKPVRITSTRIEACPPAPVSQ